MGEKTGLVTADVRRDTLAMAETVREAATELAEARKAGDLMTVAVVTAAGMQALRERFTPAMIQAVRPLLNTKLGIDTDRNPRKNYVGQPYDDDTVRDVLIEGALNGARFAGNEINILAGGLYLTREYWERAFRELPEVSDIRSPSLGFPREQKVGDKTYAEVNAKLEYAVNGRRCVTECTGTAAIRVIWNRGMSIEAIHGKVRKRLFKLAHEAVTGYSVTEAGDEDVIDGQVVQSSATSDERRAARTASLEEPDPPAAAPEQPAPEQPAHEATGEALAKAEIELQETDSIRQCDAVANAWLDSMHDDTSRKLLAVMVENRKSAIRAGRGERANG